jgi:TRAP transporter TAXI family solute receptor
MIQFIIFAIILGTFLYTQKDKIINKISQLNLNLNIEGFQMNNLFSLEKPKILKSEVNLSFEGIPVITNDSLNDFNNIISHKLQEFVPLRISDTTDFAIMNLNNVNNKKLDLTIVQEELFYNSVIGKTPFNNKNKLTNLRFIAGLYYETFILLTYSDSNINSWKDIKGKLIGFPSKESGSYINGIKIAQAYGLEAGKDFKYINVDSMNRLANIFFEKKVDAIYLTTSNKNIYLLNLAKKMSLKFIGTNDISDTIMKSYFPCDSVKYINTNNYYTNINTASFIKTYATRSVLVAHKDLDPEYVFNLTKTLYERSETLKLTSDNYLFNRDKLNLVEDAFMPSLMAIVSEKIDYHDGAQKYYNTMFHSFETHVPLPIIDVPAENDNDKNPHSHFGNPMITTTTDNNPKYPQLTDAQIKSLFYI